jgi:hypothetical protein
MDAARFKLIMSRYFSHYSDEYWGPILGPAGPHIRERSDFVSVDPRPVPWRELAIAVEITKLADALEMASPGTGVRLIDRFADEPENWCGTRVPGHPHPHAQGELDRAVLGAALDYVAAGVAHQELASSLRAHGERLIG